MSIDPASIAVNYGTLSTAASDIQTSANKLEARLNDLDDALKPMVAGWSGEARGAYDTAKNKWTTALVDMKSVLTQIGQQVITSSQNYRDQDKKASELFMN